MANYAAGDYDVAAMALERALLTTPDLLEHPVDVRSLSPHLVLWETHLEELVRYAAKHPSKRRARLLLGYLQYAAGDGERALSVLGPLADSDPGDDMAALLRDVVLRVTRKKGAGK